MNEFLKEAFKNWIAFNGRFLDRLIHPRNQYVPGENQEARARRHLDKWQLPKESLKFDIALRSVVKEWDLLDDDAAMFPSSLELQRRLVELSDSRHFVHRSLCQVFSLNLPNQIVFELMRNARKGGDEYVLVEFPTSGSDNVMAQSGDGKTWTDAGQVPNEFSSPMRGAVLRLAACGYPKLRPFMREDGLPEDVRIEWLSENVVRFCLAAPSAEATRSGLEP